MLCEFRPVIYPMAECVMHMDKAGYLWPCSGCTKPRNWMAFHKIYSPCNIICDCNQKITMKDNLSDKVCIPMEFKDAYKKFPYMELCKHAMCLFHVAARNCGGQYFNLKSILGDVILLNEYCDEIFCILSDQTTNNLSMRKWDVTEACLEKKLASSNENKKAEAIKKAANAIKWSQRSIDSSTNKRQFSRRKERGGQYYCHRGCKRKKLSPRRYYLQRSAAAANKDTVKCASTTNGNIEVNQSLQNARTPSNWQSTGAFKKIQNLRKRKKRKVKIGWWKFVWIQISRLLVRHSSHHWQWWFSLKQMSMKK